MKFEILPDARVSGSSRRKEALTFRSRIRMSLLTSAATIIRSRLALSAIFVLAALNSQAQPRFGAEPTRDEQLRGPLSPMRSCYDVKSYQLDVRVDPSTQSIKGSNKILFQTVDDFEKMQVDLFSNLDIEKIVFDDKTPATYTRELNSVFVQLPAAVKKGSNHSVTFYYGGKPTVARRPPWEGGVSWDHDSDGNPWVVVTSSETGACLWWPLKDHPSDEPDNMSISITVPPGLDEISNGRLKARTVQPDGWVRYDWFVSYPINSYCVTFNIGKYAHFDDEYVSADGEKLTLDYYVLPKNLEKAKETFKQAKTMLKVFEKYFGKYPFYRDGYKLVECPHTGMEHQTAVAYGNRYLGGYRGRASSPVGLKFDFIIVHESGHEWWGNNVSEKDPADMWIHESFTAYAESLFVEDQWGHDEAIKYINAKKSNVRNTRPIISEYNLNRKSDGDMYDKGQLALNTLRSVLDDDALWFSILRGIQETYRYQNVSFEDIVGYVNKKTGKDFSYFFEQYFKRAAIPRLGIEVQQDGDSVTARYRWQADVDNFRMPVKVTTAPGKFGFITPTSEWQTLKLQGMSPDDFKVAEDLFYMDTRIRRGYLDPHRNETN
jgi:aminopeptidase N